MNAFFLVKKEAKKHCLRQNKPPAGAKIANPPYTGAAPQTPLVFVASSRGGGYLLLLRRAY